MHINEFTKIMDGISLKLFLQKLKEFEDAIVSQMTSGSDFTVRLEVRGNKKEMIHVRVYTDTLSKPEAVGKQCNEKFCIPQKIGE